MKIKSTELIEDLKETTNNLIETATAFQKLSIQDLNLRLTNESWSILECVEHINLYGEFYLKEFEKAPYF